ncbi:tyrosine-type recombinase/integrase [Paenibacillus chartarius]|uniref:Tyrosine-type recombinase/integrase n=1 Tax=Paenibacillus chartarius TaxID=747481 RepID=A0ABV6DIG1_9BACL
MKETESIIEKNDPHIHPIRNHELWKGIEYLQWSASSTGEIANGIKNPHIDHPRTDVWDVSMNKVRNIMETLFDYDLLDENNLPKKSISNWLWEYKIEPDIRLETVKSFFRWVRDAKPPIELYRNYIEAMEFQERISVYCKKPMWKLTDLDVTESSLVHCSNFVNSELKKSFLSRISKLYFPCRKFTIVKKSKIKRSKLTEDDLHPFLLKFNNHLRSEGISEGHIRDINQNVMLFLNWLEENFADFNEFTASMIPVWLIERDHILGFENHLKRCHLKGNYSEITCSNKFYCVTAFFKFLYEHKIIPKNIGSIRGIKVKRYLYRDIPTETQISQFFNTIACYSEQPDYDTAFFGCLLHLGLRFCEVERLNWNDINFQAKIIKIRGKGKAEKPVPMNLPNKLLQYLESWFNNRDHDLSVFKGDLSRSVFYGKMLDRYRLYAMISGWDFPGGFHLFRHTFITKLSQKKNVHPDIIKRLARHNRLETTSKYLHRQEQELNNAMRKIDGIWS